MKISTRQYPNESGGNNFKHDKCQHNCVETHKEGYTLLLCDFYRTEFPRPDWVEPGFMEEHCDKPEVR